MVSEINFDTMIEKLAIDNALILKEEIVLTDTKLRNLKPQGKMYKVPDRGRTASVVHVTLAGGPEVRRDLLARHPARRCTDRSNSDLP